MELHEMYDGDEPKIDLEPDLAVAIRERFDELREKPLNAYLCGNGHRVATRNVHVGLTPAQMPCPTCGDVAKSAGFPATTRQERDLIEQRNQEIERYEAKGTPIIGMRRQEVGPQPPWLTELPVLIEWYRPSADLLEALSPDDHAWVMRGGLVMRDVTETGA